MTVLLKRPGLLLCEICKNPKTMKLPVAKALDVAKIAKSNIAQLYKKGRRMGIYEHSRQSERPLLDKHITGFSFLYTTGINSANKKWSATNKQWAGLLNHVFHGGGLLCLR